MQVTKLSGETEMPSTAARIYTTEELQREYDYYTAQKLLKNLLDKGWISVEEFNKITERNRQSFSPFLAEIMPEMT